MATKKRKPVTTAVTYKLWCPVCGNTIYVVVAGTQAWCSNKHRMAKMKAAKE